MRGAPPTMARAERRLRHLGASLRARPAAPPRPCPSAAATGDPAEARLRRSLDALAAAPWRGELPRIEGTVLTCGPSQAYHDARTRPWNTDAHGFPLLVCRVAGAADVAAALTFATERRIEVAVAGGAHSVRPFPDGALVIDLAEMRGVEVKPDERIVTAEGGCTLGDLDEELEPHGLGVPWGTNPGTGVAGLTLAGGAGFLSRMYGLTIDNLLAVDAVLPDGRIIHATPSNDHADFLWGCKGGGGNFGVVTKFYFRAHRLPSGGRLAMLTTVYTAQSTAACKGLLRRFDAAMRAAPDSVNCALAMPCGAQVIPITWCHLREGLAVGSEVPELEPARGLAVGEGCGLAVDELQVCSYHRDMQTVLVPNQQPGHHFGASRDVT